MIGTEHVANPTLSSLATEFGLAPLLGKSLAIIADARLSDKTDTRAVIERLLSISGEDSITVNRKFRDQVSVRLPTRFLIISNELPAFGDASGAIASRFILTTLTRSFLGNEDIGLEDKLLAELPGILNWALAGLERISRQRFTVPKSSAKAVAALQDLVSPMSKFVRECCDQGRPDKTVVIDTLYERYREWCNGEGEKPLPKTLFGRDLRAVLPRLDDEKPHGQQRRYIGIALKPHQWGRSIETHNAVPFGSSGSNGLTTPDEPHEPHEKPLWRPTEGDSESHEPHEPHENPLQRPIDGGVGGSINGRCPHMHTAARSPQPALLRSRIPRDNPMTKITLDCRKAIVLDWNDSTPWNGGEQAPCIHCGRPAFLLDDAGRPAHKVCAQAALAGLINKQNSRRAAA